MRLQVSKFILASIRFGVDNKSDNDGTPLARDPSKWKTGKV